MAVASRLIKHSPSYIQKMYYKLVPFHKRYGFEFVKTYAFLLQSLEWDRDTMRSYQLNQLRSTIKNAYEKVPYYHKLFVDYGINPNIQDFSDIKNIPILTKDIIRDNYQSLINTDYVGKTIPFKTSGSTGKKFYFEGTDDLYKKEAAFVLRSFNLHNSSMYDVPTVWIRRYAPESGDPLYKWDYELNRLYISPFHISESTIHQYVDMVNKTKATTIVTYPSLANFMATLMAAEGLYFDHVKHIHCASEMIQPKWRENVYNSIGVKLKAHYGMMEKVSFFCNTEDSDQYLDNMEYGYTEVVDGEVIGTGFLNNAMPLIRYTPGDQAILNENVTYHKALPFTVKDFIGRSTDMITTPDGRSLAGVNFYTMMYKIDGVEMFQIIQKKPGQFLVNIIPSKKYTKNTDLQIREGIQNRVGSCEVNIQLVQEFIRSATGKFKTIINEC